MLTVNSLFYLLTVWKSCQKVVQLHLSDRPFIILMNSCTVTPSGVNEFYTNRGGVQTFNISPRLLEKISTTRLFLSVVLYTVLIYLGAVNIYFS